MSHPAASLSSSLPANFFSYIEVSKEAPSGKKGSKGHTIYTCKVCVLRPFSGNHRMNAVRHVQHNHPLPGPTPQFASSSPAPESTTENTLTHNPRKLTSFFSSSPSPDSIRNVFSLPRYHDAIAALFTQRRLPFSAIEWKEFQELSLAANPYIEDQLIKTRRSLLRMIITNEVYYREQIKESLQAAVSSIHISSDLWSSPNRHSLLGITAQWVDKNCELQTALLALPECRYTHSGEHQAELLLQVLENYNVAPKIGWHTRDNATSNDTTLQHLEQLLYAKGIIFNAKQRRVRCIAHIINLSLQAFLLASSKEALEAAFAEAAEVEGEEVMNTFSDVLAKR